MRRVLALAVSIALLFGVVPAASANNDPHRFFMPQGSIDWEAAPDGPCAFPVHLDVVANNEYGREVPLADGSTLLAITGTIKVRLTANGTSLDVNASGPGRMIFAPDGTTWSYNYEGRALFYGVGLKALGFPSNLVVVSGLQQGTVAAADNWAGSVITSMSRMPHVVLDVCAALAE